MDSNKEKTVIVRAGPDKNGAQLLQRPAGGQSLDQMRAKLASSRPALAVVAKTKKSKSIESKLWIWVLVVIGLLISANGLAIIKKEKLLDNLGIQRELKPLSPPAQLSLENKALFWAYAAYAPDQLKSKFNTAESDIIDHEDAVHHLAALLPKVKTPQIQVQILALKKHFGKVSVN